MQLRLAQTGDLPKIKEVYARIVHHMQKNGLEIWDEVYPCEFFAADIENGSLYIAEDSQGNFIGAFALCKENSGQSHIEWDASGAKALYLDRFGINPDFLNKGFGSALLVYAGAQAKRKGADYLRLFVVDGNKPAINLYRKNGFEQAEGVYQEKIEEDFVLCEYGYEKRI